MNAMSKSHATPRKCLGLILAAALLGACSTVPSGLSLRSDANFAEGSPLGAALPRDEAAALAPVFVAALSDGGPGARYDWRGDESFGWVKPGDYVLGNVKASRYDLPPYPKGLYLDEPLETELGLHAVVRNSNVRGGPSTDYPIVEEMKAGDAVEVVGKIVGRPWMLVEKDGRVRGYMFENLLRKAPGFELELAGGPTKRAVPCRAFEQRISYTGRSDRWVGAACLEDGQWVLQPEDPTQPEKLF